MLDLHFSKSGLTVLRFLNEGNIIDRVHLAIKTTTTSCLSRACFAGTTSSSTSLIVFVEAYRRWKAAMFLAKDLEDMAELRLNMMKCERVYRRLARLEG